MRAHLAGWLVLLVVVLAQPPGQVAADTKFDLVAAPARFLRRATHAYTDEFPLGQVQNQAYGYLFPQGPFFLAGDLLHVPDWLIQRAWWWLLLGLAYSGALALARRVGIRGTFPQVLAAAVYALSPRILTTLTAISSEAWPVALVPWTLIPLTRRNPQVAPAVVAVACMGAVNATATIAACLPAFVLLIARRSYAAAGKFAVGAAAVSAWWIGPLLVLGRYSPPFTDFIESAGVTTAWLNPVEILRGTTSWTPFVDTERAAGHLLVAEPTFVIATCLVAAFGLAGLARRDMPWRGPLLAVFAVGFWVLGSAHMSTSLYDGALAPFRNLHKFDPLVHLPLALGAGHLAANVNRPKAVGITLAAAVAVAPAWSLRLLPEGTWHEVSQDWVAAGQWLDQHAAGTRTLVVPPASFARQSWGWTRDEPIQALTQARFAFRDAVPLVDPEAIRGLEGQAELVDRQALRSIGVGAVVVRRDLERQPPTPNLGEPDASFGEVDIFLLDPHADVMESDRKPVAVDGGGEVLPLLWRELGYFPARLTGEGASAPADIVTDTPALAVRNYGTIDGQSGYLAAEWEDGTVRNRVKDYPSAGSRTAVAADGFARASSSAADAGAFGGPDASKSLTSAFDGVNETAWWPAPGDRDAWIEFQTQQEHVTIAATADTTVQLCDGHSNCRSVTLVKDQPRRLNRGDASILQLTEPVGIRELDVGIHRIVEVEGTADRYFFQRHFPEHTVIQRRFTTAEDATWQLSAPATIDGERRVGSVFLEAGAHELFTRADTVMLSRAPLPNRTGDRLILTTRAFNDGLRATLGGTELEPLRIDAGAQAFRVPPGADGEFRMRFAGEGAYRYSLIFGGAFSLLVLALCLWVPWRREDGTPYVPKAGANWAPTAAVVAAFPFQGLAAVALAWVVRRFTVLPMHRVAAGTMAICGLVLARAAWPAANYAGSSTFLVVTGLFAVACLTNRAPGTSTSS
ncbi:alpha-(1-_3)-arabinofuranosyltransferase domain-containing protein [Corynebacterium lehmanniae]|uniref:DUF3367 domain-containing protein n=1 Tax=Corynebacterium lehmanniae TaxID=2913497 RepID=A0ABT4R6H0_9CORY|nr:alpha-(1->3)-arabinofuranosyltransferase family protein [Corynebacterium lehmanniae]MCZ9291153.1 DUF3367 domain-containing protein [Corynebacterium lehmanniae]